MHPAGHIKRLRRGGPGGIAAYHKPGHFIREVIIFVYCNAVSAAFQVLMTGHNFIRPAALRRCQRITTVFISIKQTCGTKNASISRGFELIQWAVAAHFDFKMNNKLAGRFQPHIDCVTDAKNAHLKYKKAIEHATSVNYNY
jgi:hypothetical protein